MCKHEMYVLVTYVQNPYVIQTGFCSIQLCMYLNYMCICSWWKSVQCTKYYLTSSAKSVSELSYKIIFYLEMADHSWKSLECYINPILNRNFMRTRHQKQNIASVTMHACGFFQFSVKLTLFKCCLFKDESTGKYCAEEQNIQCSIQPESGLTLVFNHHKLHEGAQLL